MRVCGGGGSGEPERQCMPGDLQVCFQIAGDFAVYGSSPSSGRMLSGILTTRHSQQPKACCVPAVSGLG